MYAAGGYLNLAFFAKYVRDVSVVPPASSEFLDEFSVWLQARARRFVRQGVQDVPDFGAHGRFPNLPSLYLKGHCTIT